ncbi:TRAP transporter small permease [Desulfogranum marinum]|uniref:TRAP transporter small permease n=1 Tax=Desulfogranum marinum TaxID=453220 RepID=UPI00196613D3|nr:TRAP transporter small permease [Desulfogranum marinum]MBM9514271.1 TRAP transporter small permease [Desulfogranum marinum]
MKTTPKSIIPSVEMVIASLSLVMMTGITAIQVFNRYVLQSSLDWSEELARYLFIWAVYVGCSYATQMDRHLEVTIIRTLFKRRFARPVTIIASLLTLVFCIFATVLGTKFIIFLAGTGQKTPALEISAYWVYLCMPVGLGFMSLRTLERLWWLLTGKINPAEIEIN